MATPELIHERCKRRIVTCDIVEYECAICKTPLVGPSCGRRKICIGCSEEYDLCIVCGKPMREESQ